MWSTIPQETAWIGRILCEVNQVTLACDMSICQYPWYAWRNVKQIRAYHSIIIFDCLPWMILSFLMIQIASKVRISLQLLTNNSVDSHTLPISANSWKKFKISKFTELSASLFKFQSRSSPSSLNFKMKALIPTVNIFAAFGFEIDPKPTQIV